MWSGSSYAKPLLTPSEGVSAVAGIVRRSVAWVGSGISDEYPKWEEAISRICQECGVSAPASSGVESLITKAEECKSKDRKKYVTTLEDLYGRRKNTNRKAYRQLAKLPFKGYVTTNFDPLLLESLQYENKVDFAAYPKVSAVYLGKSEPYVFYIHGLANDLGSEGPNAENLVFAKSDFDDAYDHAKDGENVPGQLTAFLRELLQNFSLLFLGCSLKEPDLMRVFQEVNQLETRPHRERTATRPSLERFVLSHATPKMPRPDTAANQDPSPAEAKERVNTEREDLERFTALGIQVIKYPKPAEDEFEETEAFLELLLKETGALPPLVRHDRGSEELTL